jgi:hypothetical protein
MLIVARLGRSLRLVGGLGSEVFKTCIWATQDDQFNGLPIPGSPARLPTSCLSGQARGGKRAAVLEQ